EVLIRVLLRIRAAVAVVRQVPDKLAAEWLRAELIAVRFGERSEGFRPALELPKAVGIVDRVAGLVPPEHHYHSVVFVLSGLLFLNPRQVFVHQIKRHADNGDFVGTTPTVSQIDMRTKSEVLAIKFSV